MATVYVPYTDLKPDGKLSYSADQIYLLLFDNVSTTYIQGSATDEFGDNLTGIVAFTIAVSGTYKVYVEKNGTKHFINNILSLSAEKRFMLYEAFIYQAGTNAPVLTEKENTVVIDGVALVTTPVYVAPGNYGINLNVSIPLSRRIVEVSDNVGGDAELSGFFAQQIVDSDDGYISLTTTNPSNVPQDNILNTINFTWIRMKVFF